MGKFFFRRDSNYDKYIHILPLPLKYSVTFILGLMAKLLFVPTRFFEFLLLNFIMRKKLLYDEHVWQWNKSSGLVLPFVFQCIENVDVEDDNNSILCFNFNIAYWFKEEFATGMEDSSLGHGI